MHVVCDFDGTITTVDTTDQVLSRLAAPAWEELEAEWRTGRIDAATEDGHLGLYVRAGRLPNRDECAYTACVVRAGEPTVMVVDLAAPLPEAHDGTQRVETDRFAAVHECVEPLQVFRVRLEGAEAVSVSFPAFYDLLRTVAQR